MLRVCVGSRGRAERGCLTAAFLLFAGKAVADPAARVVAGGCPVNCEVVDVVR